MAEITAYKQNEFYHNRKLALLLMVGPRTLLREHRSWLRLPDEDRVYCYAPIYLFFKYAAATFIE